MLAGVESSAASALVVVNPPTMIAAAVARIMILLAFILLLNTQTPEEMLHSFNKQWEISEMSSKALWKIS
jgi:hypothetical protein